MVGIGYIMPKKDKVMGPKPEEIVVDSRTPDQWYDEEESEREDEGMGTGREVTEATKRKRARVEGGGRK